MSGESESESEREEEAVGCWVLRRAAAGCLFSRADVSFLC
jgi:hypothetical protein